MLGLISSPPRGDHPQRRFEFSQRWAHFKCKCCILLCRISELGVELRLDCGWNNILH